MHFASLAYQQFLAAISVNEDTADCLKLARITLDENVNKLLEILDNADFSDAPQYEAWRQKNLELQHKIKVYSGEFECFYVEAFRRFKTQQSQLIAEDPVMAFEQWTHTFDTEYLTFVRQARICQYYADILSGIAELNQLSRAIQAG